MGTPFNKMTFWKVTLFSTLLVMMFIRITWTDGDEGRYFELARSIADGDGQIERFLPEPTPEILTPPLYLHYLAWGIKLGFSSPLGAKASTALSYLVFMVIAFYLVRFILPQAKPVEQLAVWLMGAGTVFSLYFAWMIHSEALFLLLTTAAFFTCLASTRDNQPTSLRLALLTGLLAGLSMLTRPVGLALLPAVAGHYLYRKKWLATATFIGGFLAVNIPTALRTLQVTGVPFAYITHYSSESAEAAGLIPMITRALHTVSIILPQHLFDGIPRRFFYHLFDGRNFFELLHLGALARPLILGISILILLGWVIRLRRPTVLEAYWVCLLVLVSTYHVHLVRGLEDRYFLPVMIIAAVYLYTGIRFILEKSQKVIPFDPTKITTLVFVLAGSYVLLTSLLAGSSRVQQEWSMRGLPAWAPERVELPGTHDDLAFAQYIRAAEWIRDSQPENTVVVSRKPRHTFLFSGRKGHRYASTRIPNTSVWDSITFYSDQFPVVLIEDDFSPESGYGMDRVNMLNPVLDTHQNDLTLLYQTAFPTTKVWSVHHTQP